jgi:hypothetical protein
MRWDSGPVRFDRRGGGTVKRVGFIPSAIRPLRTSQVATLSVRDSALTMLSNAICRHVVIGVVYSDDSGQIADKKLVPKSPLNDTNRL